MKRGQISIEYLVVVGFITFIVLTFLSVALFYSAGIRDQIRLNNVATYSGKIISNAEEVFFVGEPSKVTISAYLPSGVSDVTITDDTLVITVETDSGTNVIGYSSDVPIQGSLTPGEGLREIEISAQTTHVQITGS